MAEAGANLVGDRRGQPSIAASFSRCARSRPLQVLHENHVLVRRLKRGAAKRHAQAPDAARLLADLAALITMLDCAGTAPSSSGSASL